MSTPRFKVGDPVWVYWEDRPRQDAVITGGRQVGLLSQSLIPSAGYRTDAHRFLVDESILRHRYPPSGKSLDQFMAEIKKPRVRMPHEHSR